MANKKYITLFINNNIIAIILYMYNYLSLLSFGFTAYVPATGKRGDSFKWKASHPITQSHYALLITAENHHGPRTNDCLAPTTPIHHIHVVANFHHALLYPILSKVRRFSSFDLSRAVARRGNVKAERIGALSSILSVLLRYPFSFLSPIGFNASGKLEP